MVRKVFSCGQVLAGRNPACSCFGGPTKDGWALNARAVGGIRPVAEVENRLAAMLGLEVVIEGDGAMGVEELVGDVGQDGGAARGDAAFGDEDKEPVVSGQSGRRNVLGAFRCWLFVVSCLWLVVCG